MILRIWRGWTTPEDAAAYEQFLAGEDDPHRADGSGRDDPDRAGGSGGEQSELAAMTGEGYLGFDLGRTDHGDEVEFVTILRFEDYDAVEAFAGENYEQAHVPTEARKLLTRWEDEVAHYERRAGERLD
ncbi:MAG: antibiotic biosynthesis monooxygenase [Halolamina sp.]